VFHFWRWDGTYGVKAALDFVMAQPEVAPHKKVIVFGQSIGGAVAIHLAAQNQDKVRSDMEALIARCKR
jgi:pimeloyl-ACP methyl ester carboxylesterase